MKKNPPSSLYPIEFRPALHWNDSEFWKPRYQKGYFIFSPRYADVKIHGWAETVAEAKVVKTLAQDHFRGELLIDTVFNFWESWA